VKNKLDSRDICLLEKQAAFTAIYKNMSAGRSDYCRFIAACGSEQEITMRVKMIVAYDGTNYKGWQVQPNGITIEEVLNKNLSNLLGEQIVVSGASRTDSGVHSLGNIAVFDTNTRMPADKIAFALNQRLPEDIVVQGSCEVEDGWHPRYQNSRKTYEYRILNRTFRMPTRRLDTYFYHYPLDVEKMKKAASYLEGEHDFKSFCAIGAQVKTTVRTIYACDVEKEGDIITIRVTGNGFLYNMVRIIAGTLVQVGGGAIEPEAVKEILAKKDRSAAGPTAPAHGLTMMGIEFENVE
jgi:tRNA pseudouridine38-40 synthase